MCGRLSGTWLKCARTYIWLPASIFIRMVDPIHLDFGAFQRLGPRLGEVALSEVYKLPGHGTPIQLESIQVEPLRSYKTGEVVHGHTMIRVRFTGVNGKLQAADGLRVFPALPRSCED